MAGLAELVDDIERVLVDLFRGDLMMFGCIDFRIHESLR